MTSAVDHNMLVFPCPLLNILLLRHGQTDDNARGIMQGQLPTSLNALGHEQARLLAKGVISRNVAISRIISSDLPRAMQTAQPVAKLLHLPITPDPAWRERCFGEMEGQPASHADIWRLASGDLNPPGSEPPAEFLNRIQQAMVHLADSVLGETNSTIDTITAAETSTVANSTTDTATTEVVANTTDSVTVAVVTHGGCIRGVLRLLAHGDLPLPPGQTPPPLVTIANCSIMHVRVWHAPAGSAQPYLWQLVTLNDVAHLGDQATLTDAS